MRRAARAPVRSRTRRNASPRCNGLPARPRLATADLVPLRRRTRQWPRAAAADDGPVEWAVEVGCARELAAARALFDAERTLRQHPHQTELCRAALRRCRQAVTAATGDAPLRLRLGCGEATVDGEVVFAFALH